MDARELRVGNYFDYDGRILRLDKDALIGFLLDPEEKLRPVTLTEDWLVRMGIVNLNSIETRGGDLFVEIENKEVGIGGVDSVTSGMIYYARCAYVHQLQNLYFALTGEELEIKQ